MIYVGTRTQSSVKYGPWLVSKSQSLNANTGNFSLCKSFIYKISIQRLGLRLLVSTRCFIKGLLFVFFHNSLK